MASNLNSVIIEGTIAEGPVRTDEKATFIIQSIKDYNNDNIEVCYLNIETKGNRLADSCINNLTKGSRIRVVGYLKQIQGTVDHVPLVVVVAEHVEFLRARKGHTA